jgi:hypothetical protein
MNKNVNEVSDGNKVDNGATIETTPQTEINNSSAKPAVTKVTMTVKETFNAARQAKEEGKWKMAQKYYNVLTMHNPKNWEAYFYSNYCDNYPTDVDGIINYSEKLSSVFAHTLILLRDASIDDASKLKNLESLIKDVEFISSKMVSISVASMNNCQQLIAVFNMLDKIGDVIAKQGGAYLEYASYVWNTIIYLFVQKCCKGIVNTSHEYYLLLTDANKASQYGSSTTFSFEKIVNKIYKLDSTYLDPFGFLANQSPSDCEEDNEIDSKDDFAVDNEEDMILDDESDDEVNYTPEQPQKNTKKKRGFLNKLPIDRRVIISIVSVLLIIIIAVVAIKFIAAEEVDEDTQPYVPAPTPQYTSAYNSSSEDDVDQELEEPFELDDEEFVDESIGWEDLEENIDDSIIQDLMTESIVEQAPLPENTPVNDIIMSNEDLWEEFKVYYNLYYNAARGDQTMNDVSIFVQKCYQIMTDPESKYKWLGDYIKSVAAQQGYTLTNDPNDMDSSMNAYWKWHLSSFFNCRQHTSWPGTTADFTNAGKPEKWAAYYR